MGYFKNVEIEKEDVIFRELDQLQQSFFEVSRALDYEFKSDYDEEEAVSMRDLYSLTLPSFEIRI